MPTPLILQRRTPNAKRRTIPSALCLLTSALAACCPTTPRTTIMPNLPPPISTQEQITRLTQWSRQLPRIRATTVIAGVRFDFRDDRGHDHSLPAEGTLLIRRHFEDTPSNSATAPANPGDILLLGKSFDHPAFEAGRNADTWWFILHGLQGNPPAAFTGDATRTFDPASLSTGQSTAILRPDLILDLLALSDLSAIAPPDPATSRARPDGQYIVMRVNDITGTNDLSVIAVDAVGRAWIKRDILVNRLTGNVDEVRLYNPRGTLLIRSQLSHYDTIQYPEGAPPPQASAPRFPKKIVVTYPAQHTTITLQFEQVTIPPDLPDRFFKTPDFQERGLQATHVD